MCPRHRPGSRVTLWFGPDCALGDVVRGRRVDRYLESLQPDSLLVRSLGALFELGEPGRALRIGDFSPNVANRLSAAAVLSRGLSAFTPSFDLDSPKLVALLAGALAPHAEVVVHHPMPLFHMEHCVIAALLSEGRDHRTCGRPCERHQVSLRDRAEIDHPVEADVGCRNTLFHASPQSAAELVATLVRAGVSRFRVELVRESGAEAARVVRAYRDLLDGRVAGREVFRELRASGVIVVCAGAIGLGTMAGGKRIIKTMGTKIIRIAPLQGFAAETAGTLVILSASRLGIPVSTTHCSNACSMGVGASQRVSAVRWGVASSVLLAWVLTLPLSGAVAYLTMRVINAVS